MRTWPALWLLLAAPGVAGTIDTVAGTGRAGSSGDGGPAASALLVEPFGCDLDAAGNLLIADAAGHRVRKLDLRTGRIATVVGTGEAGTRGDGAPATEARIDSPYAVAAGEGGSLFLVEQKGRVVRKVDGPSGRIGTFAGRPDGAVGDGGPATAARLAEPNDAVLDGRGGLMIADVADWRVRRVDLATGLISTFAGTGKSKARVDRSEIGDGGQAAGAVIVGARAVAVDGLGNTYLCEREGNAIRKVDARGVITTFAGTGAKGYTGDGGEARLATFDGPKGVRCDRLGNVYVVDTENHAIRKVDVASGKIATVAGGHRGGDGDGGEATTAGLDRPHGCVVAPDGTLYIADSNNPRVRRVTPR